MFKITILLMLAAMLLVSYANAAGGVRLSNAAFKIQAGPGGITSLKRPNDAFDTEYIAAGRTLGNVVIRYKTAGEPQWREIREPIAPSRSAEETQSITYSIGVPQPTLASKSTLSSSSNESALGAINDGWVRRRSRRGRLRRFTWLKERGRKQWVQYTFPSTQTVSSVDVFWYVNRRTDPAEACRLPASWKLFYQDGAKWKPVAAKGPYGTEFFRPNAVFFDPVKTKALRIEVKLADNASAGIYEWRVNPDHRVVLPPKDLKAEQSFTLKGDALTWSLALSNPTDKAIEIGDLALPFPISMGRRSWNRSDTYTMRLIRHSNIAGNCSWIFWQRANTIGPFLVMTPLGKTKFEYFNTQDRTYMAYIHGAAAFADTREEGGNWRLPLSTLKLAPKGSQGDRVSYGFKFQWAKDFNAVRDVLYKEGQFDTNVVPGMTIPTDLPALISLRTKNKITGIQPEFPKATKVKYIGKPQADTHVYEARFSKLGENMLTVRTGDGRWLALEFFVTEPLETLIKKRSSFLIRTQQHRNKDKWYDGAISDWDQKNKILRSAEDRDGLSSWLVDACDDAGNARPAYVASKNVFYPDQTEIDGVEHYIRKYLWGGMQQTTEEPFPYGIYGIPNWKVNRESSDPGFNGRKHLWRIYDYPHIIMLYYHMYEVARHYPKKVKYLDAEGYLKRAYGTAIAYFTVPLKTRDWSAYQTGTMNEIVIADVIDALYAEGKKKEGDALRAHWERKVKRFINDTPNLFGSEFSFDSTSFESTGAFAHYAMQRVVKPGETLDPAAPENDFRREVSYKDAVKFLELQLRLNIGDRGWLETCYYKLGSDYRAWYDASYTLSYMAPMGGWSILNYALHYARNPTDTLRLGYASYLCSWALVNSGTPESNYGYWFPGKENDGAAGGGFEPRAVSTPWIRKRQGRGSWYYSSEQDVGYCGALRCAATILTRDPVFGEFAYGGQVTRTGDTVKVIPRDGLRSRFHVVCSGKTLQMKLIPDGFAREQPISVNDALSTIHFTLENRVGEAHKTRLKIAGLPAGNYSVALDNNMVASITGGKNAAHTINLPVGPAKTAQVKITRLNK